MFKNYEESKQMVDLKNALSEVKELLEMKEQVKEIIENYNKNRLVKVYDNVNKSWIKFCKENNQYKMQDLYSLALLEFIEKYKQ